MSDAGRLPGLDLVRYKTKLALLLFVPRLALLPAAIVVLLVLYFIIRMGLTLLLTFLIPLVGGGGEIWDQMSGLAHMARGMIGMLALTVIPSFFVISLIPLLYCRAFFNFSPAAAIVSILLMLLAVALFNYDSADFWARVTIAAAGSTAVFVTYFGIAKLVFRDRLGNALLSARRSPPIEELYRYGLSQLLRTVRNTLIFVADLAVPLLGLVAILALHGLFQLASMVDPTGGTTIAQLGLLLLIIFKVRPQVADAIRARFRELKRRNAETATFVYSIDTRPRILLLRSFRDDKIQVPVKRSVDQFILGLSATEARLEELLVNVSYRYGPVGALADPNARLTPLGAARDLSFDGEWQRYIEDAISRAAVIMFIVGDTASLEWEIEKIKNLGLLNKTVLIFPPTNLTFPTEHSAATERYLEIARRTLGDTLPTLQSGKLPVAAFYDSAGKWQLVTSDAQGAVDYQEGLTLAYQLQLNAAGWTAKTNYRPVLKFGIAVAACVILLGYAGVRQYEQFNQEESFSRSYYPRGETVAAVIDQYKKRTEWAEARYPKRNRDSHLYEKFASHYSGLASALVDEKRYEEAIESVEESDANAKLSGEHSDDRSRSLIQLSDNAALRSRIMVAVGDPEKASTSLDESIVLSLEVAELRPTQRYYRRQLAKRLLLRGGMRLDASLFKEAVTEYEAALDAFNVDLDKRDLKPDSEWWADKRDIKEEQETETAIISSLAFGYFYAGQFNKAEEFLGRLWEQDRRSYTLLFLQLSRLKRGLDDVAWFEQRIGLVDRQKWPYPVVEMYSGTKSIEAAAALATGKEQRCEADFYAGELHLSRSEVDKGVELLRAAIVTCPRNFIEYHAGLAELRRLGR